MPFRATELGCRRVTGREAPATMHSVVKRRENQCLGRAGCLVAGLPQGDTSNSERCHGQKKVREGETNHQESKVGRRSDLARIGVRREGEVVRIRALDPFPETAQPLARKPVRENP